MRSAAFIEALARPLSRLPTQCVVCRGWARHRLCGACIDRHAAPRRRCTRCAIGVPEGLPEGLAVCGDCLRRPPPFERAVAAVDYDHPWDGLVQSFKYHAALDLAGMLAQRLLDAVQRDGAPSPDWLLPVPLAAERLRERGYNQAWELARRVARGLPCASDARLLLRMKDTPHQLALPPDRRAANVRAAFAIEPRRRAALRGCRVAVVDDVMTTGATVSEVARTLLQAGAQSVHVWVLARTPSPDDA